jgi:hypothetical protein
MSVLVHKIVLVMVIIEFFDFLETHFLCHYLSPKVFFVAKFSIIILILCIFESLIELSNLLFFLHIIMEELLSILPNHISSC